MKKSSDALLAQIKTQLGHVIVGHCLHTHPNTAVHRRSMVEGACWRLMVHPSSLTEDELTQLYTEYDRLHPL